MHEGLKPYECPHCTQAYGQSNDLYKHIRKVHQMPTNQKSYGTKLKPLHDLSRDWNANFLPYKAVKPKCELSEKNMQIKNIFKSTISNYWISKYDSNCYGMMENVITKPFTSLIKAIKNFYNLWKKLDLVWTCHA